MSNYIEVQPKYGMKLLLNVSYISELFCSPSGEVIIVLSNGNQYSLDETYTDMKYKLFDLGKPMTL